MRRLCAGGIGPEVAEGLGGQEGSGGDESLYGVLVEGELIHLANELRETGREPEREVFRDRSDVFRLCRLEAIASRAAAARIVRHSQRDSLIHRAGQEHRFSTA